MSYSVHIQVPIMLTIASRMVNQLGACSPISFQQEQFLGSDFITRRLVRHYVSLPHCLTLIVVGLESNPRDSIKMQKCRPLMPNANRHICYNATSNHCKTLHNFQREMQPSVSHHVIHDRHFSIYIKIASICVNRDIMTHIYKVLVK